MHTITRRLPSKGRMRHPGPGRLARSGAAHNATDLPGRSDSDPVATAPSRAPLPISTFFSNQYWTL